MIHIYTFCIDIGRISKQDLKNVFMIFYNSIKRNHNLYNIQVFTNLSLEMNDPNVVFINYDEACKLQNKSDIYDDKWLNMSFNKIYMYKYLRDKHNIDYIWMDLDTIVVANLEYINDLNSYFIDCGGDSKDPHELIEGERETIIPRNKWIQGNIWKINIQLYEIFMKLNSEMIKQNKRFNYDLQSLFTYYFYYKLDGNMTTWLNNDIYVVGRNCKMNVLNGLCIWAKQGNTHANLSGLQNLYYDDKKRLCSKYYPNYIIEIVSFTFYTLRVLYPRKEFIQLFLKI